ncbi:MAG TPA: GNAT family N-acetyltransferase [Polyangia bacterium]|nr:GNAT family N-acetyltransferase [Polyangia bacterium]
MLPDPSSRLRRARASDVPALLPLMRAFNRAEGIPFRRARIEKALRLLLRTRRLGTVLVAEARHELVGYVVGTFGFDLEFGGPDGFITEIFVAPEHRRAGLGRRLIDAIVDDARDAGAGALTLLVYPKNVAARALYARAGFEELPRVAMTRRLPIRRWPRTL